MAATAIPAPASPPTSIGAAVCMAAPFGDTLEAEFTADLVALAAALLPCETCTDFAVRVAFTLNRSC